MIDDDTITTAPALTAPVAFDVADLQSTDTAELAIVHPATGQPTTWVWTLAGPGHPATLAQSDRLARTALKAAAMKEQATVNRKKWHEDVREPADVRAENVRFYAERVLGWSPVRFNGQDFPYSRESCIAFLANPQNDKIYGQLTAYFQADDSFTKRSATE